MATFSFSIKEAVNIANRTYKQNSIIVVSGSMFLAAEAKKCLGGQ